MSKEKEEPKPKTGPFKADIEPPLTAYVSAMTNSNRYSDPDSVIIRLPNSCIRVNTGKDLNDVDYQYQCTYPNPEICKRCKFCNGNDKQEYVTFSVPENIYEMLKHYREIHEKICDLHDELDRKVHNEYINNDELIKIRREYFETRNEKERLREELDVIFTLPELPKYFFIILRGKLIMGIKYPMYNESRRVINHFRPTNNRSRLSPVINFYCRFPFQLKGIFYWVSLEEKKKNEQRTKSRASQSRSPIKEI